jgi:hypothetical protein
MATQTVSKDVLLDGARMTLYGVIAGTMGFLKKNKLSIKDWVAYIGDQFDGSMMDLEGEPAKDILEHMLALELMPMGVEVISSQVKGKTAEAVLTSLPSKKVLEKFGTNPKELLGGFGVTQREFDSILDMQVPAARAIGMQFTHILTDGQETITLKPAPK